MRDDPNRAGGLCGTQSYLIADYPNELIRDQDAIPPDSEGIYVVSTRSWTGILSKSSGIVYVGKAKSLRRRIGRLLCDLYDHRVDHFLWHHCCAARGLEPSSLYLGWYAQCRCLNCAEVKLRELMEAPWNLWWARTCKYHTPVMDLLHNCSAFADLSAIHDRYRNIGKN